MKQELDSFKSQERTEDKAVRGGEVGRERGRERGGKEAGVSLISCLLFTMSWIPA